MGFNTTFTRSRNRSKGANLVELALLLPFLFIMFFLIIELGRAWQTYEAVRMATLDGAYTASATQNAANGVAQGNGRLALAGIAGNVQIIPVVARDNSGAILGYRAQGTANYAPIMANFWGVQIFPPVQMGFNDVYYNGVY